MSARRVPKSQPAQQDEAALFAEVLEGSNQAWRRFVKKHERPLREAVRESTDAIHPLTPAQLDDVIGDFWLRMVDDDRRWLRRFRGGGASLEAFLRMHALDVAHEHIKRFQDEPVMVPLEEAQHVAAPRGSNDLAALASLLQLPTEVQALRADVNNLRVALEQLRRALPPALLSVADAAKALNVSTVTIRRMIRAGTLAHVRVGRSMRVDLTRTPVQSINRDDGARALDRALRR